MGSSELDKVYKPSEVEARWAEYWLAEGLFTAKVDTERESYSMVIPPPNITGTLHLGHALNNTLQDVLARYNRMLGKNVLWLPGIDHAGIATQNVVERQLAAEGTDRHSLGREGFIERVWKWKEESGGTIINQLKRLGASCDWSKLRFTMDEGLSKAVREVFVSLYKEGLIYRGDYIINWCPRCHTALSDLEVEAEETDGSLYYLQYPLKGYEGHLEEHMKITVATTRPETMLGDTAVAVNPEDERFSELIGRKLLLPIIDREIPVIADDAVDVEFGTGAVKITPAHDFNDFEMGKRHGLEAIKIMDLNAAMNENAGPLKGMDRFDARKAVIEAFKEKGLLQKIEPHKMMPGKCYRCRTVTEPSLSKQWFVSAAPLAAPAIKAVEEGRTRFIPKNWENTYFDWMHNIRDWCISRQIWWGHRIPAWYCKECDHITVDTLDPDECEKCASPGLTQETDVLDTWFSSALWPFSTLGWPEKTEELKLFYPTSALSTSFDIIFFWVARMMMMGLKFMDEVPFKDVYIHALIRDAEGKKMSKSKGNVIDPLSVMDDYGTDALRFTLAALAAQGRDIKIAEDRIEGYRNFANKIWNLARFALMNIEEGKEIKDPSPEALSMADEWILDRLSRAASEVRRGIETYRFDESAKSLYRFIWHELCDRYVEDSKEDLWGTNGIERQETSRAVLVSTLKEALKLLHPFMPFITEEIWDKLPGTNGSIMLQSFPEGQEGNESENAKAMQVVHEHISSVRHMRSEINIPLSAEIPVMSTTTTSSSAGYLRAGEGYIKKQGKISEFVIHEYSEDVSPETDKGDATDASSVSTSAFISTFANGDSYKNEVPLKGLIDVEAETARLTKEMDKIETEAAGLEGKLSNEKFVSRAPVEVVEKDRLRLAGLKEKVLKIKEQIDSIESIG